MPYVSSEPIEIPTPTIPDGDKVCGLGDGTTRRPDDPDFDNIILSASTTMNGVLLSWTTPLVNPWAVAYWVIYRSKTSDFEYSQIVARESGDNYYDIIDGVEDGETYYYWIKPFSINGLEGDLVGPASAVFQPTPERIIDILEGRLSESLLNAELKERIRQITDLQSALSDEEQARLLGDNYFTQILEELRTDLGDIDTIVANEIIQRIEGDDALVAQLDLMLAKSNDNAAAIQTESAVRANETSALAQQVQTLQASVGGESASVQTLQQAVADIEGNLSATYVVKTDVSGYVSGFGLYNDGAQSEFIVRADRFAVGSAGQSDVFPFIIDQVNGENVIALNAATFIPDASITNAKIGNAITSDNWDGANGWAITKTGFAKFNNVYVRGNIEATSIKAGTANIVDTLMLQGEAVTITRGTSFYSGRVLNTGWQTIASVTVPWRTPSPSAVQVMGAINFLAIGGGSLGTCRVRLRSSGGWVGSEMGVSVEAGRSETAATVGLLPNPGGVNRTYYIEAYCSPSSQWRAGVTALTVVGARR